MYTFKQYLIREAHIDAPHGIFVKVIPLAWSVDRLLKNLIHLSGAGPFCEDLHCTVIYSKTSTMDVHLPHIDKEERFKAVGTEITYWPGHDNKGYLVLLLQSADLHLLHNKFRKAGFQPTFPDYKPHVSIVHPVMQDDHVQKGIPALLTTMNQELQSNPIDLDFYYGGYTILDYEPEET